MGIDGHLMAISSNLMAMKWPILGIRCPLIATNRMLVALLTFTQMVFGFGKLPVCQKYVSANMVISTRSENHGNNGNRVFVEKLGLKVISSK